MEIHANMLEDLATGAVFLGTGGGGDPYLNTLIAGRIIRDHGPVRVVQPDDLSDDDFIVGIGGVGAPSVGLELLPSARQSASALRALELHMQRKIDALVPVEIGGANSLTPVAAAGLCGFPVVDGDGMGRAFPEAQMTTFAIGGIASTPAVAVDYAGGEKLFLQKSSHDFERAIREFALARGGVVISTEHPMTGAELKANVVPGTLSFAIKIGRILRQARDGSERLTTRLREGFADSMYGELRLLHTGMIVDFSSRTLRGYDTGQVVIQSFQDNQQLHIDIRNEFLVARRADKVLAMVPDLITLVDYETAMPINAERLRYGQRVSVFAIGCPRYYRTPQAIKVVGPRSFGFDFDYQSVEKLTP